MIPHLMLWALLHNPVTHDLTIVEVNVPDQETCEMTLKLIEWEGLSDDTKGDYNLVMGGCMSGTQDAKEK